MTTFRLLLVLILCAAPRLWAQDADARPGAPIASVQVSGLDMDRVSHGLRGDIEALKGTPFDPDKVRELAARIEDEHPEMVTAIRAVAVGSDSAQIVILVARISDDRHLESNINSRYTIEKAEIEGAEALTVSQSLRSDLQALVGTRLDRDATDRLIERLHDELPGYVVTRRVSRGTERGQIVLVLQVEKGDDLRWLRFPRSRSKFVFHEEQGWSGFLDIPIGLATSTVRVTPFFALDNRDDLVEEYTGWGIRVESREVLSERLGLSLELSRFRQDWQEETLAALATLPGERDAYRVRLTVTPMVTFAVDRRVTVSAGVSTSELQTKGATPHSHTANVVVGQIAYAGRWQRDRRTHSVEASLSARKTADALSSDVSYSRVAVDGSYQFRWEDHRVIARAGAGRITGEAPLFERFTLGDTSTLRGWDKYVIAPAGADRMIYSSLEYRYHGLSFFLDNGALWDDVLAKRHRVSTGLGFHGDNAFFTVGLPLNASEVEAMVMFGVRF